MASIMESSAHSTAHHPATGVPHQLDHPEELDLCQMLYARTTSLLCDLVKDLGQSLLVLGVLICDIKRSIPCIRLPSCWQGAGGSSVGPGQERKPPLLAPTWAPSRSIKHSANKDSELLSPSEPLEPPPPAGGPSQSLRSLLPLHALGSCPHPHFLPGTNSGVRETTDWGVRKGQELMPGVSLDFLLLLALHLLTPP